MASASQKRPAATDEYHEDDAKRPRAEEPTLHVYEPCVLLPVGQRIGSLVEVLLPARYLISDSKAVKQRRLWGSDVYTDDSDLVAVLVHTGHVKLKPIAPKAPLLVSLRACAVFVGGTATPAATFRARGPPRHPAATRQPPGRPGAPSSACPGQASYSGSERNGIKSREWGEGHPGVSYKVERCLQHTAGTVPPPELSLLHPGPSRQMPTSLLPIEAGPGESFLVPPSACLVVFNLSNEPCYKYSLPLVADQATTADRWTSTRLRREALYLESKLRRFELSHAGAGPNGFDTYTFSQVRSPFQMDRRALESAGVPLPPSHVEVLHAGVDWEEIRWGPCYLRLRGVEYPLVRLLYVPLTVA